MDCTEFVRHLASEGIPESTAHFVWDEFQPYYFAPLTPCPEDRPMSEFRIDGDDLSEMVTKFEKRFGRQWVGKWVGPDDPSLTEFAKALIDSTSDQ